MSVLPTVFVPFDTYESREAEIFFTTGKRLLDFEEPVTDQPDPGTQFFDKFFADAGLAAGFQKDGADPRVAHALVERLQESCAARTEAVAKMYRGIAASTEEQIAKEARVMGTATLLAKRSAATRTETEKTADGGKIEREFYPSGTCVVTEFDAAGVVVKTRLESA